MNCPRKTPSGFTLIELLVVIAIIAILAAILFPVFQRVRENARRTTALSNCNQLLLGMTQYQQDADEFLPMGGHSNYNGFHAPFTEWQEAIYPFVKSEGAYMDPDDNQKQDDTINNPTMLENPKGQVAATSFLLNINSTLDPSTATDSRHSTALASYSSPANYILLMSGNRPNFHEAAGRYVNAGADHSGHTASIWGEEYTTQASGDTRHMFGQCGTAGGADELAGLPFHKDGVIFGFLDGHVKFIVDNVTSPVGALEARYPNEQYGEVNDQQFSQGSDPWAIDVACGR